MTRERALGALDLLGGPIDDRAPERRDPLERGTDQGRQRPSLDRELIMLAAIAAVRCGASGAMGRVIGRDRLRLTGELRLADEPRRLLLNAHNLLFLGAPVVQQGADQHRNTMSNDTKWSCALDQVDRHVCACVSRSVDSIDRVARTTTNLHRSLAPPSRSSSRTNN